MARAKNAQRDLKNIDFMRQTIIVRERFDQRETALCICDGFSAIHLISHCPKWHAFDAAKAFFAARACRP